MSKHPAREPATATKEQVEEALGALNGAALVRLQRISAFRHRSLGTHGAGRNEGDLLSDAIIAALDGRRKWKTNIDFVVFLRGVIRSLASHIRAGRPVDAFHEIAPNPVNEDEEAEDFVEQLPTSGPIDPERHLLARDLDAQIRERFNDDPVVLLVYEAFLDKMKPAEIQACLGIDEKAYNAAAKRLRRATTTIAEGGPR